MGILYIVATPIGNLGDITFRALEILKKVEIIYAEDTRVTQKITSHFSIDKKIVRYDEHHPERAINNAVQYLKDGKDIALVTDAGTPGISDPGSVFVSKARDYLPEALILSIPGPSAVIAALSVSGLPANKFTFLGYPPQKNKRKKFFMGIKEIDTRPVVIYESPHRLQKTFSELGEILGLDFIINVSKEITKIHETTFTGKIIDAEKYFEGPRGKGEFVIIIP